MINGAVVFVKVAFAESTCRLISDQRFAVGLQAFVSAVLRDEMLLAYAGNLKDEKDLNDIKKAGFAPTLLRHWCRLGRFLLNPPRC